MTRRRHRLLHAVTKPTSEVTTLGRERVVTLGKGKGKQDGKYIIYSGVHRVI